MKRLWPFMNRCWSSMMGRARHTTGQSVSLDLTQARQEIGISGEGLDSRRAQKRPPVYLVFPPGRAGKRKRTLLGLDDDESHVD